MPALESNLRRQLETVIIQARDVAEDAARSALQKRAVDVAEPFSHFGAKEKELRNRLRARGRQVGDVRNADKTQDIDQLTQELAYEFWHRMLFARFLAENHLLMHPDGVAVTLEECAELAPTADPPASNGFVLAARYASTMLPQIFRTDDVLLEIDFAPEQRLALEKLLTSLPRQTFLADDSLGWVYQFWQSKRKDEVNKSGKPIDGRTLPAVTQLFTEHYMVQFLLHNTIGAWWCGQHGIQGPPGGAGVPAGKSPVEMEYLRWGKNGTPEAGTFEGWPKSLAEFTMLDPCCGSGHFLVAAFNLLVPLRMHDEKLTAENACEAVLRDNIFGLELDPRCTQIAAFALALAAWRHPDAGGYRLLPPLNIACSGQGVTGKKDEWLSLANENNRLREGMDRIYDLFQQAPHLGSLIDPRREKGDLFDAGFVELHPLVSKALAKKAGDAELAAIGIATQGIAKAAELLSRQYTLVTTNVPYLGRGKQNEIMQLHLDDYFPLGIADLATAFVLRSLELAGAVGTTALVSPQNWLSLSTYKQLRMKLLETYRWVAVVWLGEHAFESPAAAGAFAALTIIDAGKPSKAATMMAVDVSAPRGTQPIYAAQKAALLANQKTEVQLVLQGDQLRSADSRVLFEPLNSTSTLKDFCGVYEGSGRGDTERFDRMFWELVSIDVDIWKPLVNAPSATDHYAGRELVFLWENGTGQLAKTTSVRIRGSSAWGKAGVFVARAGEIRATLTLGATHSQNGVAIVPGNVAHLPAIWCFCSSPEYSSAVRKISGKIIVPSSALWAVPFDFQHWHDVAARRYPNGLPNPHSDDPTQWFFKGEITTSTDPLQVAVARLLGYRWPEQSKATDAIDNLADSDGILCLPGVRGEAAAAERLLEVLRATFDKNWSDSVLHKLLIDAGCKAGATLDDWLCNQFIEQHYKRFHNRPFIWHVWDGRKDGFSALVNYHKLDHKTLENLTYSYLGDWIKAQGKSDKAGADLRLAAAQELQEKLKLILACEPPYDIFVRWKPLHEQAIGWHPDLNDGVRMNIRPFVEADILRKTPNIKWTKDRGGEPERDKHDFPWFWSGQDFIGDRVNDVHLTNEKKTAARSRKKGAK